MSFYKFISKSNEGSLRVEDNGSVYSKGILDEDSPSYDMIYKMALERAKVRAHQRQKEAAEQQ